MKFEPKISGTRVTDFQIERIFNNQIILLKADVLSRITRQEAMDYILDTFRFTKCGKDSPFAGDWFAIIDGDTDCKIAILEMYPEYEKEMIEYFGESWLKQYIRFNH